jgi:uncharacterized protein (DUF58 family)
VIGPLAASIADPFDLAHRRIELPGRHELIVYPAIESLDATHIAVPIGGSGESSSRQLHRTGEEFYTMRRYEIGDDLRRIHWPSVARTGELMIRQDETARRSHATLLLDTRAAVLGERDSFERAVSVAASIGVLFLRAGFALRLATPDLAPTRVTPDQLLETLALVRPSRQRLLAPVLSKLRAGAAGNPSLVAVLPPPTPEETTALLGTGASFGPRVAVLVQPPSTADLYLPRRAEVERQAEGAQRSLQRGGWEALLLHHDTKLYDLWRTRPRRTVRATAASW